MEHRCSQRKRTFLGAKIVLNRGSSILDCIVKDMSNSGARLSLDGALTVPEEFDLALSDGKVFHCAVKWRRLALLGVSFMAQAA